MLNISLKKIGIWIKNKKIFIFLKMIKGKIPMKTKIRHIYIFTYFEFFAYFEG